MPEPEDNFAGISLRRLKDEMFVIMEDFNE
jgi:hypothetical protein